jgi:cytochrome c551/c552
LQQEAADLTAYLMASRDPSWEDLALPAIRAEVRDEVVRRYLEEESTLEESATRLQAMTSDAKDLFLGERSLRANGCAGCHDIPGLEDADLIGPPLHDVGRRPQRFLEASSVESVIHPKGRRGAPDYGLSNGEAAAVRIALLSWRDAEVETWRRAEQGERALALSGGRRLLWRFGCLGCHQLEGRGGALALTEPVPPQLTSVGSRLRSSWLFAYLNDPGSFPRRPWMKLRMPSFDLRPEEANDLVRFFAAHDDEPLFVASPPTPDAVDVAVGRSVAIILNCDQCHQDPTATFRAPSYQGAKLRLRPDWVVDWILDPQGEVPGTAMPVSFTAGEHGVPDSSFVIAAVSAPMFAPQMQRLLPLFDSEEDLHAYLADSRQVAAALRDYLWSRD